MQQIDNITPEIQQLVWVNRDSQVNIVAQRRRASDGALHIEQTVLDVGLEVVVSTLDGWMKRTDFNLLKQHNLANTDEAGFILTLGADSMRVMWDNTDGAAVFGENLWVGCNANELMTNVTMKFIIVGQV